MLKSNVKGGVHMKYDLSQLEEWINERKRSFKTSLIVQFVILVVSVLVIALYSGKNDTYVFCAGLLIVIILCVFANTLKKYNPAILFSPEITGINIKEDEYVLLAQKRGFKLGKYSKHLVPHAGSGMPSHRERLAAAVYLRLENGDIYLIDRISTAHTNLYEIGDTLYKPAGAKYPIIISRETAPHQPCPLCGSLNDGKRDKCRGCGLNIFN
jgi:hypothetical protein